ncbi:Ionotropic receptor 748 [Blattella germanica]|nr:Ionotropic receptor 748 [Blattella germanica]
MEILQLAKLFIFVILFQYNFAQLKHPKDTEILLEEHLSDCILDIYQNHLPKSLPVIVQTTNTWYQKFKPILEKHTIDQDGDILLKKLNQNYISQVTVRFTEDFRFGIRLNKTTSALKVGSYILLLSGKVLSEILDSLIYMIAHIVKAFLNPLSRLVLATSWTPNSNQERNYFQTAVLNKIWQMCEISDAIVVVPSKDGAFDVVQWLPDDQTASCMHPLRETKLVDRWFHAKNNFEFGNELFPRKRIEDIPHCTIKVSKSNHWPYLYSHFGRKIIGVLPSIIAESLKGKPFQVSFARHRTSISGGLYFPFYLEPREFLDECNVLYPYFVEDTVWCVPYPGQLPRWKSVIQPFDTCLWFFVLGTFLFGYATFWLIHKVRHPNQDDQIKIFLNTLSTQLLGGIPDVYKGPTVALFFILWMFYSLLIGTAYQSALFSCILDPGYYESIENIENLKRVTNYPRMTEGKESYKDVRAISLAKFVNITYEGKKLALLSTRATAEFLFAIYHRVSILPITTDHLHITTLLHGIKYRCVLHAYLQKVMSRFLQFGIVHKFYMFYVSQTLARLSADVDENPLPLLMWHLQGAFYLCVTGIITSVLVFVAEHLKYRYIRLLQTYKNMLS